MPDRRPTRLPPPEWAIGVDGCRAGWALLQRSLRDDALEAHIFDTAAALVAYLRRQNCVAMIDMPVGLADSGRRACETAARKSLGPRRSSVFAAPRRPMLDFDDYHAANAWGKAQGPDAGGGLSKQAWNITPKIRALDAALSPDDQAWLGEGHPELGFMRLTGAPCRHPKRTDAGARERRRALREAGLDPREAIAAFRKHTPTKSALADDDILDAAVLSLSAQARISNNALRFSDEKRDRRGLVMEIWG
ncbi:MAG: DUF429 domain-containing protein [Pseudomonadota bacterium]